MCSLPTLAATKWWNYPKTGTGYGPQITLPTSGLNSPEAIAADSSGDVAVLDSED